MATTIDLLATEEFSFRGAFLDEEWATAEGNDPQVIFSLKQPLAAGWYRFETRIEADDAIAPQLFFDLGEGFNELLSIRMKPSTPDTYVATVKVPGDAPSLRLDPMSSRGRFRLQALSRKRVGGWTLACNLGRYGWAVFRQDPRLFAERLPTYLRALKGANFLRLEDPASRRDRSRASYARWIERYDFDEKRDRARVERQIAALETPPLISVLMPVYNTPPALLRQAIESVRNQIYGNWQLCIADDCSTSRHVAKILSGYAAKDGRIRVVRRSRNGHISEATNSAFELADGDWIALLDHDDMLRPNALAEVALEIDRRPDAELIYSDEDKIDYKGRRYDPYFKPDFSRELFRSQNYLNHLTVHRAANIRAVGGWRRGFEGSQDYDISLRILERIDPVRIRHIPKILYHWRAVAGSTALAGDQKNYAYEAGLRALQEHVARSGLDATVEQAPDTPYYRMRFAVPEPRPLVSLIIPTRDRLELLRGCVESIIGKTTYAPYEIIVVDNGSRDPGTLAYLDELRTRENVRVLSWEGPFNYSAINNHAVSKAGGDIVGLINNDIEVISPDWLTEMVSWAAQGDIGCVGAKLYYANDTIQHGGVIAGLGGVAGHSHKHASRSEPGYFFRLRVLQNLSAVTGACLLVRKKLYLDVGGLNEDDLKVAFNDVDFCLKVREAGYCNVWTPYAELYHLESVSRGSDDDPAKIKRFQGEVKYMLDNWNLTNDPYYSPNLSYDHEDFSYKR